jgi:PAS domain-containing protein
MAESADRTAEENAALLNAIVESLPFRVYALDAEGRSILQNSVSIQDFGNLVGSIPSADDPHQKAFARAMRGEVVWDETQLTMPGGVRHYRYVVAPIKDGGTIRGIVGVDIDITEQIWRSGTSRKRIALSLAGGNSPM